MAIDDRDIIERLIQDARLLGEARMLRDEQPLTEELTQQVLARFKAYLERTGRSMDSARRSIGEEGISAATLSQVVNGKYGGDSEKFIRKIDRWLEQQIMREAAPKPPGYVKTGVAKQIESVVRWALKTGGIVVVTGPNGCGKTMTLHALRAEIPGAVYCSIDSSGRRVSAVLEGIESAMRIGAMAMSCSQRFQRLVGVLKGTERLVMVDEVHKLAGRQNDDALHVLRDLHDATGCPMVWAGNGRIASYIRDGHTDGYDPLDQIFGRISFWLDLTEAAEGQGGDGQRLYTLEDIQRVFAADKIRLTPDATRYLASLANDPGYGCLRAAKHLLLMALVACKDGPITADTLRKIQRSRLGKRAADAVDARVGEQARAAVA